MKKNTMFLMAALLFGSAACSKNKFSKETFSYPDWREERPSEFTMKKLVFATTNSFLGKNEGVTELIARNRVLRIGGIDTMKFYLDTLKDRYGKSLVLLDAGYLLGNDEKEKTLAAYESFGHDAILFTENELKDFALVENYNLPFIASNIIDIKTGKNKESKNLSNYKIIEKNGIKIGLIGTTTFKKGIQFDGVYFEDPILSFLKARQELKKLGAEITVLLIHSQTECANFENDDIQHMSGVIECADTSSELEKIISRLPIGSVDLIIGGDAFNLNEVIKDIPVLQNHGQGMFISMAKVYVDAISRKVIQDKTKILDPVKLCTQFFVTSLDCHITDDETRSEKIKALSENQFKMKLARFLGKTISL